MMMTSLHLAIREGKESVEMLFNKVIDSIETKASNLIKREKGDYIDNEGLLMCGKCNTRKQCVVEVFGKKRMPYCMCKCAKEKANAEYAELERQERMRMINELRTMGFPDEEMRSWTFENDDHANPKVSNVAKSYVENFPLMLKEGKGLLFYGNVGSGKTYIAACIANSLIDEGHPCLVTNFPRLINAISGMYEGKQQYIDGLNKFDLLVIDDLAAERDTEYMNETVQNIIDNRYRCGKPLIVTTNLSLNDIQNPTDIKRQRTYSRLAEMCFYVKVISKDRRKNRYDSDYQKFRELLGLGKIP